MLKDLSSLTLRLFGGKRIYTTKMVNENSEHSILEYLQKNGAENTFKLAHVLDIKRDKLLGILKNLEEQGLVKIATGKVEFLSYPISKERIEKKPEASKEKLEVQVPKKELEKQKLYIEKLKAQIKKLEQKPQKEPLVEKVKAEEIKPKPKRKKKIKIKESKSKKKELKIEKSKKKKKPLPKSKPKKAKKIKKVKFKLKLPKLKMPKIRIKGLFGIKKFIKNLKRR